MFSPKSNILHDDIIQQWWNYKIYTFTKSQGIDKCFISLIIIYNVISTFFFSYKSDRRAVSATLPSPRGALALWDSKYALM